jgi:hypothetical protein
MPIISGASVELKLVSLTRLRISGAYVGEFHRIDLDDQHVFANGDMNQRRDLWIVK